MSAYEYDGDVPVEHSIGARLAHPANGAKGLRAVTVIPMAKLSDTELAKVRRVFGWTDDEDGAA